ncbi:MAG TPA: hypothetical protein DEF48_22505 [Nostoc sp. UBA8866]|nr:hypothetical protein [Nostoc sp. UBA8866]
MNSKFHVQNPNFRVANENVSVSNENFPVSSENVLAAKENLLVLRSNDGVVKRELDDLSPTPLRRGEGLKYLESSKRKMKVLKPLSLEGRGLERGFL